MEWIIGTAMWFAIVILCAAGWIANVVKLVAHIDHFGLLELARAIGVIAAPLGVVLGFV